MTRTLRLGAAFLLAATAAAQAQEYRYGQPVAQGWYLEVGAAVLQAPRFEGADRRILSVQPLVSLGRHGRQSRFSSRNDNISLGLLDTGSFRAGLAGKLVFGRDGGDGWEVRGLDRVRWGGEAGVFAEFYPSDWVRVRGEVRHGIRSHDGIVADFAADAFMDVFSNVRLSGGPRVSFASARYFDAWYGVSESEAAASGLAPYRPKGGLHSYGLGGAVTWKTTDTITTSVFGEVARLAGPAADSSLVRQRGSKSQTTLGASATYRFDFGR